MATTLDLRCEAHPFRLLARMRQSGERPRYVEDDLPGTLIELACRHCHADLKRQGIDSVRVLHRFNVLGERVQVVSVASDGTESLIPMP